MNIKMVAIAIALLLASSSMSAQANCGGRAPIDYNDIDAVMLKQTGCAGTLHLKSVSRFVCSAFFALFWHETQEYSYTQYNLHGEVGTYKLKVSMQQVRDILRGHDFFSLSPRAVEITDTSESVVSVKRCAVTTRLRIFNLRSGVDRDTLSLLTDLRSLVERSPKKKVSGRPKDFEYSLIFDP